MFCNPDNLSFGIAGRRLRELRNRRIERRAEFAGLAGFAVAADTIIQIEFAAGNENLFVVEGQGALRRRGVAANRGVCRDVKEARDPWRWRDIGADIDPSCFEKQEGDQDEDDGSAREAFKEGLHT